MNSRLITLLLSFFLLLGLFVSWWTIPSVQAQCVASDRNQGLISGKNVIGFFGNSAAQCVKGDEAPYVDFKVPNYNEIKSLFFTQNKNMTLFNLPNATISCAGGMTQSGTTYLRNLQDLTNFTANAAAVNSACYLTRIDHSSVPNGPLANNTAQKMVVIFAENDVAIDSNLTFGGDNYGLIIIAKGNIFIAPTVSRIDAVIVTEGNVYTTSTNLTPETSQVANSLQLVINGSLISLSQAGNRIFFTRSLANNTQAAEVINYQPKYLVLLRGLLTQSYTIQREIEADEIPSAALFPSPTVLPSPSPTIIEGSTEEGGFKIFNIRELITKVII
jgi:hypothetical protein